MQFKRSQHSTQCDAGPLLHDQLSSYLASKMSK